ncbi:DEAD/DEAH box helicase [Siphonobacter sp. SORGH_AS_1065]|uniref:DEAD/DEAH box helicase n=1 Tax=Siphonobacter sp. SORGH_AS_1065 TaxID=3041795 RepID=UPI0027805044|nr:DEAD/DEAH box helicase [Siphonobacter sp. SORGH_AS_1065]MDQ1088591.1 SNF2 family DNA or RNA helicase [Siphonobacter sp. SORGH_AS_1065]
MKYVPHQYQEHATRHIIENEAVQLCGGAGLFLEMGLGKTVATLTAINELMYDRFEVNKVLVIAPLRVALHTWPKEVEQWDHLKHLRVSVCIGTEKKRKDALRADADVYTINRENVPWLVAYLQSLGRWPFDMVVIDELSSFKDPQSGRFKALKTARPLFKRIVGLTGTPAPNTLIDLWSQLYLLDRGERLGKTIGKYRESYFTPGRRNGHVVYEYLLEEGDEILGKDINQKAIYEKVEDICLSMKAEDWLTLPPLINNHVSLDMPSELRAKYKKFERDSVLQLADADDISSVSAASLSGKLTQFSNGAVYDEDKNYHELHKLKIEALADILEAANGQPVLCFYRFKSDVERIMKYLKAYKPYVLTKDVADLDKWNRGEIPFLLAHPASAGHGLNMQHGGNHLVWFGLPWSLELYQQAVARLHRQGQKKSVINTWITCTGTIEEDIIKALDRKAAGQNELMKALKARIQRILNS